MNTKEGQLQGAPRKSTFYLSTMSRSCFRGFAAGGEEALTYMDENPVDVVVSDMRMPGMTGSQLLEEVSHRHPETVRSFSRDLPKTK